MFVPLAFTVVTERLNAERKLYKDRLAAAVAPLHALLARHMQAFMTCAEGWQLHGAFARAAAASCTELTLLLPSREALPGGDAAATSLLEGVHTACGALMQGQPLSGGEHTLHGSAVDDSARLLPVTLFGWVRAAATDRLQHPELAAVMLPGTGYQSHRSPATSAYVNHCRPWQCTSVGSME